MLAGIVGALVVGAGAIAADTPDSSANPYQGIVDRNVFALKPPPPPPDPESLKPPMPGFELTGITTIFGNGHKRAMFKAIPKHGKGVDPAAKEKSYMLAEGQREGDVEVNRIDEVARTVTLTYDATVITIDFTNNAAKAVSVAAAPPPPRAPGVPGVLPPAGRGVQPPGGAPAGLRQPGGPGNDRRPIRSGNGLGVSTGQPAMGVAPTQTGLAVQQQQPVLTREQQEVVMEAMREQGQNDPTMPPLPPTSLTPLIEAANQEGKAPAGGPVAPAPGYAPPPLPPGPARPF